MKTTNCLLAVIAACLVILVWLAIAPSERESACVDSEGRIEWSKRGDKWCDIPPYTAPGGRFGDTDWIIND